MTTPAVREFHRDEIEARLRKGSPDELRAALSVLVKQYPNLRDDGDYPARMRGYAMALRPYGIATVKACVVAALDGRIARPGFMPLAPEMAAWCRAHERIDREELARIGRTTQQIEARNDAPNEATRERVHRGFERLSETLAKTAIADKLALGRGARSSTARKGSEHGDHGGVEGAGGCETPAGGRVGRSDDIGGEDAR